MVKCIICGKEAEEDIEICKSCKSKGQRQGGGASIEQSAEEKILDNIMAVVELTEGTTTKNIRGAIEAILNISDNLRRNKDEEKQEPKAEEKEKV